MTQAQVGGGQPPVRWKGPTAAVALIAAIVGGFGWGAQNGYVKWPGFEITVSKPGDSDPADPADPTLPPRPPTLPAPVSSAVVARPTTGVAALNSASLALAAERVMLAGERGKLAAERNKLAAERRQLAAQRRALATRPTRPAAPRRALATRPVPRPATRPTPRPATRPTPRPVTRPTPRPVLPRLVAELEKAQRNLLKAISDSPSCGSLTGHFRRIRLAFGQVWVLEDRNKGAAPLAELVRLRTQQIKQLKRLEARAITLDAYSSLSEVAQRMSRLDSARSASWVLVAAAWLGMSEKGPRQSFFSELHVAYTKLYGLK